MLDDPKQFLHALPNKPGVYQMYDADNQILYVGKAKNLKRRLANYFRSVQDPKTELFMAQVKDIEIIVTPDENAALLLESNLIKTKKPRYNVTFKDDKSFPYLLLSHHDYPRLTVYRGAVNKMAGKYFGPFPDATAVNFVYDLLQRIFQVRVCKDSFMQNRSRPCMLYQIKRCRAPCVGYIDKATYALQVKFIEQFLSNRSNYVVQKLTKLMDLAATQMDYELAANYRDQIVKLRKVQVDQAITKASGNYDVIALMTKNDAVGISVLFVRHGLLIGNKNYFPETPNLLLSLGDILAAFVTHYYLQAQVVIPDKILLNMKLPHRLNIMEIFREKFKRKIILSDRITGAQKQLITMAEANAANMLRTHHKARIDYAASLLDIKNILHLSSLPKRIECFDVSHTMGESQVASCVVFNAGGPSKSDYRRFNIKTARAGDDYGALREVLLRRYSDCQDPPDVIMVDGGQGQLGIATQVLQKLQLKNVTLIAIAKGQDRKPGLEEIYIQGSNDPIMLPRQSHGFHLLQQIRDEAHRFAITSHRQKMLKSRQRSELENIAGVGRAKRTMLLKFFGGISELRSAGVNDLVKVKGISRRLAERIYEHLHA